MTKPTHGGSRPGAGRYRITGNAPGEGEAAQRITVTLPPAMVAWIDQQPGANRSERVRGIVEDCQRREEAQGVSIREMMQKYAYAFAASADPSVSDGLKQIYHERMDALEDEADRVDRDRNPRPPIDKTINSE